MDKVLSVECSGSVLNYLIASRYLRSLPQRYVDMSSVIEVPGKIISNDAFVCHVQRELPRSSELSERIQKFASTVHV